MDKKTRLVIEHSDAVQLENVKFVVSTKGVEKIRATKRKRVVAFVEGDYVSSEHGGSNNVRRSRVYFNPYKVDQFMIGELPIYEADHVYIEDKNIYTEEKQCVI
jgi:hypothetical protein